MTKNRDMFALAGVSLIGVLVIAAALWGIGYTI